ncbi:monooxygenase [Geminicoccus harenae]|uniref:monooxygenase n=1 Tax=Geminicoccus harenae TaxID=2498453 RepID=UPI00168BD06A|nr:monooxygenase [Geminicoccus harenae]
MNHMILVFDFPFDGPWGDEMAAASQGLAEDISTEQGLVWKIWTENRQTKRVGGIHLFNDPDAALRFRDKHLARLKSLGLNDVFAQVYEVNQTLSQITRAPI